MAYYENYTGPTLLKATIDNQDITNYIDSINIIWGAEYYYMIQTIDQNQNTRNSLISSNINTYSSNTELYNVSASNSEYNRIIIEWEHNLTDTFYQLEVWRSDDINTSPLYKTNITL